MLAPAAAGCTRLLAGVSASAPVRRAVGYCHCPRHLRLISTLKLGCVHSRENATCRNLELVPLHLTHDAPVGRAARHLGEDDHGMGIGRPRDHRHVELRIRRNGQAIGFPKPACSTRRKRQRHVTLCRGGELRRDGAATHEPIENELVARVCALTAIHNESGRIWRPYDFLRSPRPDFDPMIDFRAGRRENAEGHRFSVLAETGTTNLYTRSIIWRANQLDLRGFLTITGQRDTCRRPPPTRSSHGGHREERDSCSHAHRPDRSRPHDRSFFQVLVYRQCSMLRCRGAQTRAPRLPG